MARTVSLQDLADELYGVRPPIRERPARAKKRRKPPAESGAPAPKVARPSPAPEPPALTCWKPGCNGSPVEGHYTCAPHLAALERRAAELRERGARGPD